MAERSAKHRTIAVDVHAREEAPRTRVLPWPWYLVATVGAVAVLAAGWLLLAGATALGWLTTPEAELADALGLASHVLLLGHGVPVVIGNQSVSLVPLLLTALLVVLGHPVAALAARQAAAAESDPDDTGRLWVDPERLVIRVAATYAGTYAAATTALALGTIGSAAVWRAALGGLTVGAIAGWWGAARALGHDLREDWPRWLRAVPTAISAATLVCLAAGALVLAAALFLQRDRVIAIHDGLDPGLTGTVVLVVVQLLYLPNLALWGAAWLLGGGITLGDGSLVALSVTDVGFLPAVPVLGAVPDPGGAPGAQLWWLSVGALAGVVAAVVVALARPRARFDETALVGGVAGAVAGLAVTVLAALASGGLGSERLAHIGAKLPDLAIVAPSLLGLSGLVAGLVLGLVRRPERAVEQAPTAHADEETL